ncbi:MAG: hypothetical protein AAB834_08050 [Patescibacteria group bacterium]
MFTTKTIRRSLFDSYSFRGGQFGAGGSGLHDYEKIIDFDNQYNTELEATKELMRQIGFEPDFSQQPPPKVVAWLQPERL